MERGNLVSADETKIPLSKIISRQRLKKNFGLMTRVFVARRHEIVFPSSYCFRVDRVDG